MIQKLFSISFLGWLCLFSPFSQALSSLQVSPIILEIPSSTLTGSLKLTNNGKDTALYQLSLRKWIQEGNSERYEDSKDLLMVPPIFSVKPNISQLIRVAMVPPPQNRNHEIAYRLQIKQVLSKTNIEGNTIRTALDLSIPVFIMPPKAQPQLVWTIKQGKSGELVFQAKNVGNAHAVVSHLTLEDSQTHRLIVSQKVFSYVFPGNTRSWSFNLDKDKKITPSSMSASLVNKEVDLSVQSTGNKTDKIPLKVING